MTTLRDIHPVEIERALWRRYWRDYGRRCRRGAVVGLLSAERPAKLAVDHATGVAEFLAPSPLHAPPGSLFQAPVVARYRVSVEAVPGGRAGARAVERLRIEPITDAEPARAGRSATRPPARPAKRPPPPSAWPTRPDLSRAAPR